MADDPMGKVGRLLVRVRGGDAPGEAVLTVAGAPEVYLAYSSEEIEAGTDVLVVGTRAGRAVDVVPWNVPSPAVG